MLSRYSLFRSLIYRCNKTANPIWRLPALIRSFCDSHKADKSYAESTRNTPKYQLQPIDKFFLVVTRTMKRGEIPDEVSYEVVEKSQNRRRIMVNMMTMFLCLCGSAYAIRQGRKARDHHTEDTVFERNVKRYENLKEEDAEKEIQTTSN